MNVENKINRIIEVTSEIKPGEITVLVGENGTGKSLVRKQMNFALKDKYPDRKVEKLVGSVSMQKRTKSEPAFGGLCNAFHDCAWMPTSVSTYDLIKSLLNLLKDATEGNKRYLIIDEPEIGMSRESQIGIAKYLQDNIPYILEKSLGLLIITHSEDIVEFLKDNITFINLNVPGMTADEWINREVIPTDFEKLSNDSNELFQAIANASKK